MGTGIRWRRALVRLGAGVALATVLSANSAFASAITDYASQADALLQQGKPAEALDAFDKASGAFWAASPLQFRTALFASSVQGFGQYVPRPDSVFHSGETATVYLEPVGYGFTGGATAVTVSFTTAIEIRTAGGLILAKADDFGNLDWHGRTRSYEVHAAVNVTLPQLKPGDYRLVLTLTDSATAKTATVTLPFSIVG